ncbi:circadian clock-controlled protein daywake [Monomorium pharaonis]|uniref:circadian clock-controlled protein daywake n=1 Tax=Monomorium pharaonis TaxID=307658 RepID=UPI0017476A2F|nr:circadian clock-controlled protein daywake [Monomorium pharaonis]
MQLIVLLFVLIWRSSVAIEFEDHFRNCHPNVSGFDVCVREGLNAIRPYFKTGLPKYNVLPFDPFFAKEITAKRGIPNFGFTLTLRNVTETGWSLSKVTKFVSDLANYKVTYTQSFPEKFLTGNYEFKGTCFSSSISNRGKFTLALYDLIQTTVITKVPGQKLRANMDVQVISDLKLHITNLLFGKQFLENILDKIINNTWQSSFVLTKGLINELVSTAFTDIFDYDFRNFPFEQIFKSRPTIN